MSTREYYQEHRDRILTLRKLWNSKHPQKLLDSNAKFYLRLKAEVLTHYSNNKLACVECGFTDLRALSIDHINGGGNQMRKRLKKTSSYCFYGWLKRNSYPSGYQTLCMNCQVIKRKENREFGLKPQDSVIQ